MKAVAIITENNSMKANKWQFDKVMSAVAYDMDLSVVFMPEAINQLKTYKAWNSLILYGIENIYFFNSRGLIDYHTQFQVQEISTIKLKKLIKKVDIVL